ncbi:hypothetical protein KBI23_13970 [bacterium]|nr:hypothetical protein [bacterium]
MKKTRSTNFKQDSTVRNSFGFRFRPQRQLLLLLLLSICLLSETTVEAAEPALFLKQKSLMLGRTELLYCKEGIKLDLYEKSQILLMRPPLWRVQLCHTGNKRYWEGEAKDFKSNFNSTCAMFRPGDASSLKPGKVSQSEIKGLSCIKYQLNGQKLASSTIQHTWQRLLVKEGDLFSLPAKEVPAAATKVLSLCFGAPITPGIPISMKVFNNGGTETQEFEVLAAQKKAATTADFRVPSSFKRVSKPEQITNNKAIGEDFAEIFK